VILHGLAATLALPVERLFGYPAPLALRIGHPVVWMGALIGALDGRLNRDGLAGPVRKRRGVVALVVLLLVVGVPTAIIAGLLRQVPGGWVVEALLATALLAQKALGRAVRAVADGLGRSLGEGRTAVRHIVGRDPEALDEAGVVRAAIESLAENASDGVIAPLFWLLLFGLPGIALYKAVNTADSMIGHKSPKYRDYGWASARFDDLVNWVPARLTGLLLVVAATLVPGMRAAAAWDVMLSDAAKHDSPNAGWPEAAMAGALGVTLGGPRAYDGEMHELPTMGHGRVALDAGDVGRALRLYGMMLNLALVACVVLAILFRR
jgi:adenosylcobinamide-phosphate synthase